MSRHRNVRNLVEDDYYDYDDDDYDDDDYDDYPPPKQKTPVKKVPTTTTTSIAKTNPNKQAGKGVVSTKQQQGGGNKVGKVSTTNNKIATAAVSASSTTISSVSMPSVPTSPPPGFGTVKLNDNTIASSSNNNKTTSTTALSTAIQTNDSSIIPEYFKQQQQQQQQQLANASTSTVQTLSNKPSLNVVVIGHVDAGKSTLTGRLLHYHTATNSGSTNSTNTQQQKKLNKQQLQNQNNNTINYSWLLDEDIQERERGITMDIGTKFFSTPLNVLYNITIIDSPGHADYVPAMIVGTSTADVAIVVIDCSSSGNNNNNNNNNTIQQQLYTGQLREHLLIARGLDIKQLLIVFNKMDIVLWNEQYYKDMKQYLLQYITSNSIGFTKHKLKCIPVSGYNGINVITKFGDTISNSSTSSIPENMKWITNEITLLEGLYTFDPPPVVRMKLLEKPFRMIIGDIHIYDIQQQIQMQVQMQPNNNNTTTSSTSTSSNSIITGIAIRGKIIQGWIKINEKLILLPSNDSTSIQRVLQHNNNNNNSNNNSNANAISSSSNSSIAQSEYIGPGEFIECILDDSNFTDTSKKLLSNGMILCRPVSSSTGSTSSSTQQQQQQPTLSNHFRARILLIDPIDTSLAPLSSTTYTNTNNNTTNNNNTAFSTIPIIRGSTCIFHMHYLDVPCYFSNLLYTFKNQQVQQPVNKSKPSQTTSKNSIDNNTNNNDTSTSNIIIERKNPRALTFSSSSTSSTITNSFHSNNNTSTPTWAMVEIILNTSNNLICMESYNDCRTLGRFILRRNGISIAIGRIEQVLDPILL